MPIDPLDRFFRPPVVLVIDDEEGIRLALSRLLAQRGFTVHAAGSGEEGIALLAGRPGEVSLVICDFKMPGLDGLETLARIGQQDPGVVRVLLTAYATLDAAIAATNHGIDAFLTKPYQARELQGKLDELLAGRRNQLAASVLANVALLRGLPRDLLAQIYPALTRERAPRGTVLHERGATADRLVIVREGELRLEAIQPDGRSRPVAYLGPGEHFGEGELVTGEPSPLRAVADVDTELYVLARREFDRLKALHPQLGESVARAMTRRLHRVLGPLERPGLVIACAAALDGPGGAAPPSEALLALAPRALALALAAEGADVALLSLSRAAAGGEPGPDARLRRTFEGGVATYGGARPLGADEADVPRAIAALRQAHRVVVVELPAQLPAAAARALDHSTRRVTFAPGPREELRATLAWLGPEDDQPPRAVLVPSGELDRPGPALARVARRLLGTSLGLVLGAGGPRGMAHIGVLAAFERAGLAIDGIAGCSIGAIVGGLVAGGEDAAAIRDAARDWRVSSWSLPFRPNWIKPRQWVMEWSGDKRIEDCQIPFACNATDLVAGEQRIFDSGPLADAVCASMAAPGIFPPYFIDGRVYSDGALVNGLPADLVRGHELIVAVDVLGKESWTPPPEAIGWRHWMESGLPSVVQKMGALKVMIRALLLSAHTLTQAQLHRCDLTIRPQFGDTEALRFDPDTYALSIERGEAAGEPAARDLLLRRAELLRPWTRKKA